MNPNHPICLQRKAEQGSCLLSAAEAIDFQAGWLYLGRVGSMGEGHSPPWFFPSLWENPVCAVLGGLRGSFWVF